MTLPIALNAIGRPGDNTLIAPFDQSQAANTFPTDHAIGEAWSPANALKSLADQGVGQPGPAKQGKFEQLVENSVAARLSLVTGEGIALAGPGFVNAMHRDLTHLKSGFLPEVAKTAAFAVGMRLLLPSGEAGAVVGGAMLGYFVAKDALGPMVHAWSQVYQGGTQQTVKQAARQMGSGLGAFAWDATWSLPLCQGTNLLAGAVLDGAAGAAGVGTYDQFRSKLAGSAIDNVKGWLKIGGPQEPGVERSLLPGAASLDKKAVEPFTMVLIGAAGDLSKRKLVPALYELYRDNKLPDQFTILGSSREAMTDDEFRSTMKAAVKTYASDMPFDEASWNRFQSVLHYHTGDMTSTDSVHQLKAKVGDLNSQYHTGDHNIFYLSTQPSVFGPAIENLAHEGLVSASSSHDSTAVWPRVVIEKPFGHDVESAIGLNDKIHNVLTEDQIYRVDHYLGKQPVQNIMAFRFQDGTYEPIWNKDFVDHIEITNAETLGVEGRGGYYEDAGALRDMVQNHLLQVLSLLTMEPPKSLDPASIRAQKSAVMESLRPIDPDHVDQVAVRGQYGPGTIDGKAVPGYRQEASVSPTSNTETYAALKMNIDNDRWRGVPISLSTGKRLPERFTDISVYFKHPEGQSNGGLPVPDNDSVHASGPGSGSPAVPGPIVPDVLTMHIQPTEDISVKLSSTAGSAPTEIHLKPTDLTTPASLTRSPTAYERLILDSLRGDPSWFAPADFVERSWRYVQPILDHWKSSRPEAPETPAGAGHQPFPNYSAGSKGPQESDLLLATTH